MVTATVSRALGALLGFLGRIPAIAWLVLALACWGAYGHHQHTRVEKAKQAAALAAAHAATVASEAARTTEHQLTAQVQEISDELYRTQHMRASTAIAASKRLQHVATNTSRSAPATAACRSYDVAPAAILSDKAREHLIELATEADEVADQLRACQAYVRNVVQPNRVTAQPSAAAQ